MTQSSLPTRLRILMISAELDGFARTGGLGDAVSGLARELSKIGHDVLVATPRYAETRVPAGAEAWHAPLSVRIGWGENDLRQVRVLEVKENGLTVLLLDEPSLFMRDGLYGDRYGTFGDNEVRFATLGRASIAAADAKFGGERYVLHAHDWHASFAPLYAKLLRGEDEAPIPCLFTIHNLAHQGIFTVDALDRIGMPTSAYYPDLLEHYGAVNFMKGAIAVSERVTTVSPTYAGEILTERGGCGLDPFLRSRKGKLAGLLNGIDVASYDPSTDPALTLNYDEATAGERKPLNRRALAAELGLREDDSPLVAAIGRLTSQKGIDLLLDAAPAIVARGARLAIVGSGDPALEARLRALSLRFPGGASGRVAFDEGLARRIFASADVFVVPSRFEPCGLVQMYALRYGAVPVVAPVGGLVDSIEPLGLGHGTGVVMSRVTREALVAGVFEALDRLSVDEERRAIIGRAMRRDLSWATASKGYVSLYESLAHF